MICFAVQQNIVLLQMEMVMKALVLICLSLCTSITLALFQPTAEFGQPQRMVANFQDQEDEQPNIRTVTREIFMRGKLASNQKIVEGLTTKDFELIHQGALEVKLLVKGQHWFVIDTAEYKRFSQEMEYAADKLQTAAKQKNMDAAALRYFGLTMSCLDCHRYIENRKY